MSFENLSPEKITDLPINEAVPQIFNKGLVYVAPSTPIRNVALFLIPIRNLFMGGIVVMEEGKPIGKIGPKHILKKILDAGYPQCMDIDAKNVMVSIEQEIRTNFIIREVLELFLKTRFGFSPIMKDGQLVATISTRDFLPIIAKMNINMPLQTIASDLIYISDKISVENTLQIMFKKNLRKIAIKDGDGVKIVDDRSLLGFLFSGGRGNPKALDIDIGFLPKSNVAELEPNTSISKAAEILLKEDLPCSIFNDRIVTPWDLVMKVLGTYVNRTDMNETNLLDSF